MKKIKLISSMLCVLMAFGAFFGVTAAAQENSVGVISVEKQYLAGATKISNSELDKAIISGWDSMSQSIDISKFQITTKDIKDYYFNLVYNNPSYFYIKTGYSVSFDEESNIIYDIYPNYILSKNQIDGYRKKFDSAVDNLMSCVDDKMSDFEKILTLHDALAMNCQYDENYYLGKTIGEMSYTAYGALVDKNAVCQGYSLAYKLLLDKCGIDSAFASSDKINHMWNMVKIDGQYYHVDVTWDDGRIMSNRNYYDISGHVSHVYFLQTDSEVKESKNINDLAASVKATDSKYSKAFFRFTNPTNIFVINGAYYYINTSGDVIKRAADNEKVLYTVNPDRWNYSSNSYRTWIPSQAMLAKIGNDLYFNEMNSITKLSLEDGSVEKLCDLNLSNEYATIGLCVSDGELRYDRQDSSGNILQLIKLNDNKTVYGDVNNDGKINMKDVLFMRKYIAGYSLTDFNAKNGDVNCDGRINMKDVLLIRKYIAGYPVILGKAA